MSLSPATVAAEQAEEALCLDFAALQAGARRLFLRAVKAHATACDESNTFAREDTFQRADDLIDKALRLLAMAKEKVEQSWPEEG